MKNSRLNPSKEDIENFKNACNRSRIKTYTNGYESHWIDEHPQGLLYRDPHNDLNLCACKDECIMVLNSSNVVVSFIKNLDELEKFEEQMHLVGINNNTKYSK